MTFEDLAEGWVVWNEERYKTVLTYRPDVFDSEEFPAPCLPTIHLTKGRRDRRPGRNEPSPSDPWIVTLYLEPDVVSHSEQSDSRERARDLARSLAARFAAGKIDYRSSYQVPRPAYLDRLDELTGRLSDS